MITISLTLAILIYSGILLLGAAFVYLFTEISTTHAYRVLERQNVWKCGYCAFTYLEDSQKPVAQCPRCGSFNSQGATEVRPAPEATALLANTTEWEEARPRRNPSRRKRPGASRRGPRRRG